MYFKNTAILALATGFAAEVVAKPVQARAPEELPAYHRRDFTPYRRDVLGNLDNVFNLGQNVNQVSNQGRDVQVAAEEQSIQAVSNGNQQAVIEQTKQVLIVNQQNSRQNDLFRKANARRNNNGKTTVMLVVQQVQIAVADANGNQVQEQVFAQSAVIANRGQRQTETVMVFAASTLIANAGGAGGVGGAAGVAQATGAPAAAVAAAGNGTAPAQATQTADVQLFGQKPTWSSTVADAAATLAADWQAECQDALSVDNNAGDNSINQAAAQIVGQALQGIGQ